MAQPAMFSWQQPLAALFGGISAAAQPGGFANFGAGVNQTMQQQQQAAQAQQMAELRDLEIQQQQQQMARANQEAAQREAAGQQIAAMLGGGIQTASAAGQPNAAQGQPAMFQNWTPEQRALVTQYAQSNPDQALGFLTEQAFAQPPAEKLTDDQREYQFAQSQGYKGGFLDFILDQKKAGAPSTTVNNSISSGESPADAAQRKKLSEKEGERWSALQESGTVAAGLQQDFEALDQLIGVVPSGPIEGRLAEAFPGFSSAGDAFQSIVVRVAPSLRTPGSGATSDVEYEGMLKSLPRLRNQPEANTAIAAMMKAKAAINLERAQVVTAYQNEQITAAEARSALSELNNRSIMTPDLKQALEGVTSGGADEGGWQEVPGMPGVKVKRVP
jgi:hypothetical protein